MAVVHDGPGGGGVENSKETTGGRATDPAEFHSEIKPYEADEKDEYAPFRDFTVSLWERRMGPRQIMLSERACDARACDCVEQLGAAWDNGQKRMVERAQYWSDSINVGGGYPQISEFMHCISNCENTQMGACAEIATAVAGELRELQERFEDPEGAKLDSERNAEGRQLGSRGLRCSDACRHRLPEKLNPRWRFD